MLFDFIERLDHGTKTIATVRVDPGGKVTWEGEAATKMHSLLVDRAWPLLDDKHFNEANADHWRKLPELITGSRVWVERLE